MMVTPRIIHEHFSSNSPWLRPEPWDCVRYGDPEKPVSKAAVCWYPALDTLRAAHAAGCDVVVTHEPLFWYRPNVPDIWNYWQEHEPGLSKKRFLDETGMAVVWEHDSWDQWPEIGIRDSWARYLGFDKRYCISEEQPAILATYEVSPQPLRKLAQHVADRVRRLGEDSVRVMGDPDRVVSRPSLGVGCGCPNAEMVAKGSDVLIMCYDGAVYWEARERLYEAGAAEIVVEHGTSEMPGIENMCQHLSEVFPQVEFQYFAEHPKPWTVMGQA